MGNPNIGEEGKATQFSKTNQPKNPGRKPSRLRKYLKDNHLGNDDVSIIMKTLLEKSREELQELIKKPRIPILIAGAAAAMLKDMVKGHSFTLQWLTERGYGKAKELIEHSGKIDISGMSSEARKKRIDELNKKRETPEDEKKM